MAQTKEIVDKQIWEDFLKRHSEANFLQSWYWGEFHKNLGNKIIRVGFYKGKSLIGVMLSIVENAKRGRYLTVPAGPIIDWSDKELVRLFVEEIKRISKENKCVFVRVRPQLISNEISQKIFKSNGFITAPLHLHAELTSQLDLPAGRQGITKSEDELLAAMRKSTRYEVKKALNLGIRVLGSKSSKEIKKFYQLQLNTAKRQGFVPFSYKYLFEQFEVFASEDKAILYSAYYETKLLAQAFVIFYGQEAVYHYGASTDEGRKYPGAYLIQWEAIKEAQRRGLRHYNFWGVAPEEAKNHRFYGLSVFKRGFGGKDVEYLHAQDLVINKPRYFINWIIETLRKRLRSV